jgi:hypothetical protein
MICLAALWQTPAGAATITVTTDADSGAGSLRQAIAGAASGDTITFDNDYTITLASELDIIDKTVTITGAGHLITISGNNAVRVFHVGDYTTGGSGNLTVDHLNIVNGKSQVEECAGSAVACGGGLMLEYLTTATVLNCTFSNNDGGLAGGAIYSYYGNPLTVTNSTFTDNHATAYGGAIEFFYGSATLTNNTFNSNSAQGYGGALLNTWGNVTLRNNIFIKGATSINTCFSDFADGGSTTDGGGNVRNGDTSCPGTTITPLLGTLGYYGGDVPTMPLLPGSGAIDAATSNCPATDARGVARSSTCDAGAYESRGFTVSKTGGDSQSAVVNTPFANPLEVTVSETGGSALPGALVSFSAPASGASLSEASFTATADSSGIASATVTANGQTGSYMVAFAAAGAASDNFTLTNVLPPDTVITSHPASPTNDPTPSFTFSGSDGVAPLAFECRLNQGDFEACTSPKSYAGLSTDNHTFQVRAVDSDGNRDATPASFSWLQDVTAPNGYAVGILQAYINDTNTAHLSFVISGAEDGSSYSYEITSSGGGTPVTGSGTVPTGPTKTVTGVDTSALGYGLLTLTLSMTDAIGNPGNTVTDNVTKTRCLAGTYGPDNGTASCIQCPAGTYSADDAAAACLECAPGYTSPAGAASCTEIPATTTTTAPACIDTDGDGYGPGCAAGDDCNDGNAAVHDTCTECTLTVMPRNIGRLIGKNEAKRRLLIIGPRGADYDQNTPVTLDTGAIEILDRQVFFRRFLLLKVSIDGEQLEKGDYTVTVENCTGTIHMVR